MTTQLGIEAKPELILSIKLDVVFIANGSCSCIPDVPGIDKKRIITAVDLLLKKPEVGQ